MFLFVKSHIIQFDT